MVYALIAACVIALISVIGAIIFARTKKTDAGGTVMLPLALGVFLSVIFFELIPEAIHESEVLGSAAIAVGFMSFFLLSRILRTFHHHHEDCEEEHKTKNASIMVLAGDTVHNFADGIVIGTAFIVNPAVGIATTIGIALHEIPQEIAEFTILLRAGYSRQKAILLNLASAASVILGVIVTYLFLQFFESVLGILIGIAAGNLLYISASDLLPQFHTGEHEHRSFWKTFLITTLGLVLMTTLLLSSHG